MSLNQRSWLLIDHKQQAEIVQFSDSGQLDCDGHLFFFFSHVTFDHKVGEENSGAET